MGNGITPEPWTTSIGFTVTPTDDPDVVKVPTPYGNYIHHRVADIDAPGVLADAARAYFDAHPNPPKKGQYISATRRNGTVCPMSEPYTPDTSEVRAEWSFMYDFQESDPEREEQFDRWLAAHDAKVAAQAVTAERAKVVAWLDGQSFGKRLLAIKDPVTPIEYNQSATNMGAAEALKRASRAIQAGAHDGGAES